MPEKTIVGVTTEDQPDFKLGITSNGDKPERVPVAISDENGIVYKAFNKDLPGVRNLVPPEKRISNLSDVAREVLRGIRPYADATATGIAGTAGLTGGPGTAAVTGVAGGVGMDYAIQKAMEGLGEPQQGTLESLQEGGIRNAENEFGGIIGVGLMNKLKGIASGYQSRATVNPKLELLRPYYDEMINEGGGPSYSQQNNGFISKGAEDIFGGEAKAQQLKNAARAGEQSGIKLINRIAGKNISSLEDPFDVAQKFGGDLEATKNAYLKASDQAAETVKHIASLNPSTVIAGYNPSVPGGTANAATGLTPIFKEAKGPVVLGNAYKIASDFLKKQEELYDVHSTADLMKIVEDLKKPLVVAASQVAQYKNTPIPFEAAWELKKAASEHGGFDEIAKSFKQGQFSSLSSAIDDDIERSIKSWNPANRDIALKAYQEAKTLVSNRHELFQSGDAISQILKSPNSAKPQFDQILSDPLLTGKAIAAAGPGGRSNLQAYQIQKILQDSFDAPSGQFDRKKLIDTWNDPNRQAVFKKLYNSAQRADIDNFVEALGNVSQKQGNLGRYATAIRVAGSTVSMAGSLLTGTLQSHHVVTPAIIVGGDIALSSFVKNVLLNPKVARAATIMMNLGPASQESRFLARQVVGALNGVRLVLQTKDGKQIPGEVRDGQIVPLN